jgi:hypothetical protein
LSEIGALGLGLHIGEAVNPPFAVLADPAVLFADPVARPEGFAPYAGFLARLACARRDHEVVALHDSVPNHDRGRSPPMTSSAVGWPGQHNTRLCSRVFCGTMRHVRVRCTLCRSTKTCDTHRSHVKILNQAGDPAPEPRGDDVATLGLDMPMGKVGRTRGGFNPFLQGDEAG